MGSLESATSLKRDNPLLHPVGQRPRSRPTRLILFKKIHYLHWISAVAVFFSFVVFLQMLLPGSGSDKSGVPWMVTSSDGVSMFWDKIGEVDFGEDIKFEPSRLLLDKFQKDSIDELNSSSPLRMTARFGNRKPLLALIFGDLHFDSQQILMSTVSIALLEIGYEIEVYVLEDGPAYSVWEKVGVRVNLIGTGSMTQAIDWLKYDGVIVNSVGAMEVFSSLLQDPFKNVPLVWTIHDSVLADHLKTCLSNNQTDIINEWKRFFNRPFVIVFPNYSLPTFYSAFDTGNYFVIPGSPAEAWEADNILASYKDDNPRAEMGYGPEDFIIVIVGSKFLYKGLWLEHALILKALSPFSADFSSDKSSNAQVKILVLVGDSTNNYTTVMEVIALNLGFTKDNVKSVPNHGDSDRLLSLANLVVYGSFLEEQSFPEILIKAMYLGKPIIAPNLAMISKYVHNRVNGYLFPKDDINSLTQILREVVLEGKLSSSAHDIASVAQQAAKNLMASETIDGYGYLMEKILKLPSEVAACRPISEIPMKLKGEWQWYLFESIIDVKTPRPKTTVRSKMFLEKIDERWNQTIAERGSRVLQVPPLNETTLPSIWKEEKDVEMANAKKRREDEELKDRTDQPRGTWDEVYRSAKRADRTKNDLHERDDGELERTGQPLCIYEPFIGEGTWPFLHRSSLYRGIGLSTRGRRPGGDDIDAPSRLPLLNNPYYRDALGDYGAFLAIANRIDHIHKNAWIGFQSWRVSAQKASLSKVAETALLDAINARKHGDTLYFWVGLDKDPRNRLRQDFWSFCDAINAGNCKFTFLETLKRMYGIKTTNFTSLPSMPNDGGTWSVMNSWVLPTKSFLEFVMFSRMFVDALEAQIYEGQPKLGHCYLSLWKGKHCYARVLELLVNVWAYHSGRHMVYLNPNTGEMQEQHALRNRRRGQMWVKWFTYGTLKSMDEDLADEIESDHFSSGRLWPSTGEVFWQGTYEKEKNLKNIEKEKRKKLSKDKLDRMRKKHRQKTIGGKFLKPPPDEDLDSDSSNPNANSTMVVMVRRLK